MNDCLFCNIIAGKIPTRFIFESDTLVSFPDIHPAADLHLLIVPKEHIGGIREIGEDKGKLLIEVYKTVSKLVEENNLQDDFYRVVVNGGKSQHIPHLHFHLLGGRWNKMI